MQPTVAAAIVLALLLAAIGGAYLWSQRPRAPLVAVSPRPVVPARPVIPARAHAAHDKSLVVMYDGRLAGILWKVTACSQVSGDAQVSVRVFNDYRATFNADLAITKRSDRPGAGDWIPERVHLGTGLSPVFVRSFPNYTCGQGDMYAALRHVRFGTDRGPYAAF